MENDEIAYNIMLDKYKPLIYKKALKYYKYVINNNYSGISLNDFISEGLIAFDSAVKTFDVNKNYLFFSFFIVCLKSRFNIMLRSLFAKKNKPLLHYQELEFEICDVKQIDPYIQIDNIYTNQILKNYLNNIDFIDSIILQLRLNNFKYREIIDLLDVNSTRINRVVNKAKKNLSFYFI